ncbi:MAG TPA: hypothetical protein PKA53_06165 [Sphingobacterium sp.]|nr:hypothetical protein [Sphingobacterium sp.]
MPLIQSPVELSYRHAVPYTLWCYWEGDPMSGNRLTSFEYLQQNIQVPICLLTPDNLHLFIKPEHPFPDSYQHLSIVHRSDYVRAYMLYHYGGGWHDIKATEVSYANVWKEFENPEIWIVGKPEIAKGAAKAYTGDGSYVPDHYKRLIAVPAWVGRPHTALAKDILDGIENLVTYHAQELKKYPAKHPRDKKIVTKSRIKRLFTRIKFRYQGKSTRYPLEWTLFGNVFHPVILKYNQHVSFKLPYDKLKNAGIYHRG